MLTRPLPLLGMVAMVVMLASQAAQEPQVRPMQADGVLRLLTDLEGALSTNNVDELVRLASTSLPTAEFKTFVQSSFGEGQDTAAVRERDRRPVGAGFRVLVEMLIGRGGVGKIGTWQLLVLPRLVQPGDDQAGRFELAGMAPVASIDGLVQLTLDTTQQYAARDLVFTGPGLTVRMSSGSVFLARVEAGATALVFRGKGVMLFAPDDPAEQVQVRAVSGKPALETDLKSAFIRINPGDFDNHLTASRLVPVVTNQDDLRRAGELFEEFSQKSYALNLGDLTTERWSLLPPVGDLLAELHTDDFETLTYVRAKDDAEDVSLFDREKGHNISVYASAERLTSRGRYYNEDDAAAYDVEHYDVDVRIDPEREWISGSGSLRLKTKQDGLTTLSLRLAQSLTVSSVSSPQYGRLLALRVAGRSSVLVSLPAAVPAGTELIIEMAYSGRVPAQIIGNEALLVGADSQQTRPYAPERTVLPEPRYLYSNRSHWYPQASVTDFATASLKITVPAQFQVVASGSLLSSVVTPTVEEPTDKGDSHAERAVSFSADRPLRYVACVISRFVSVGQAQATVAALAPASPGVGDGSPGTVNIDVVATPRLRRSNGELPERTAEIVEFFASQIGEAPYPDFTLATMDDELPSGHSPAYFAIWNQPVLPTNLTWRDDPVSLAGHPFFFLAHEVAHQWWGQAIGWKNYHEQWLSEGLAQYFAALYAGHVRGPETERRMFLQMRGSAQDLSKYGPVHLGYRLGHVQGDARIFRGLVYNKAAVVLHMLRRFIGEDVFAKGIRRFYRDNRFQKAGTGDLRQALEAESGQPLERFLERWIHGFTLPELKLSWRMADATHVTVRVEQLGDTFDLPLTVTLRLDGGQQEQVTLLITTKVHETTIPVEGVVQRVDTRDDMSLVTIRR